ncbi:MAG: hypothetical protein H0X37_00630 [Herpetosiphonaceae bacterium]|nr:hypothetical protein [Herpetosiphonaceae bacterium]
MAKDQASRRVLLIGGPSGVGKTIAAQQVGERCGIPWLQVDDLRLALQSSQVVLPTRTADLYFFLQTPNVWSLQPERLRDALVAVGEVLSPAIEVVIANHVDTVAPVVIEGDGILPSLFARPVVRERVNRGQVGAVFLVEPDEAVLLTNMVARGRGAERLTPMELQSEARAKWLYGQWLVTEACRFNLPVVEARPWDTLVERIMLSLRQ